MSTDLLCPACQAEASPARTCCVRCRRPLHAALVPVAEATPSAGVGRSWHLDLSASKARFAEAQRIAKIGSWELDLVADRLFWSDEIFRIFEIDPQEFEASYRAFLNTVHPDDRQSVDDAYARALATRQAYEITHRLQMADGRIKWVAERCETEFDPTGRPLRSIGTVQDITERVAVEQALRASEARWRTFVDHATDAFFIHDSDDHGRILDVNRQACESLGYSRDELIGRLPAEIDPELTPERLAEISALLQQGQIAQFDSRHRRKDGTMFPVAVRIRPFLSGGRRQAMSLCRDITNRLRAEEQIAKLRNELAHVARLTTMGELASGLAHELNQPLAALHLYAQTACQLPPARAAELNDLLARISEQALRAGEIVRRMRSFASPAVARQSLVDLNQLIRELLLIVAVDLRHSGTRLALQLDHRLPNVLADGIQIQQVIVNFIRNALDAMSGVCQDERVLTIKTEASAEQVCVSVSDTGTGLAPQIVSKLFEPFQTTKSSGLGLGLAICRTLIEAHNGQIGARPNVERGTVFYFLLPRSA